MSTYLRYASESSDAQDVYWEPRITKNFDIERIFEVSDKYGSRKRTVQISLDNRDGSLNSIHNTNSLLNKQVTLYHDDSNGVTKTFVGVITEIHSFGYDVVITIGEELSLYLQQPLPDLQLSTDYYSDTGINDNWNTCPIIIGTVKRLKTPWVDYVFNRFIIGSGPIASIDRIYFDKVIMYDKTRNFNLNIFKLTDDSKSIGVILWKGMGWANEPETQKHPITGEIITSEFPGISYIEFYDAVATNIGSVVSNNYSLPPLNADGSAAEVFVDVQGICKLGSTTEAERNPASILYQLATNPLTSQDGEAYSITEKGERGFGLGIPSNKINFVDAITFCENQGLVLDGVIAQRAEASEWFDEIAMYCMSTLCYIDYDPNVPNSGKYTLVVDTESSGGLEPGS